VFEAKVDAGTLFQRARRQADTNVSPPENQATTPKSVVTSGYKLSPQEITELDTGPPRRMTTTCSSNKRTFLQPFLRRWELPSQISILGSIKWNEKYRNHQQYNRNYYSSPGYNRICSAKQSHLGRNCFTWESLLQRKDSIPCMGKI